MQPLRYRFMEDMRLGGDAARTREAYVHAVGQLVAHNGKPPVRISEEEVRQYFLYLKDVKAVAPETVAIDRRLFLQRDNGEW